MTMTFGQARGDAAIAKQAASVLEWDPIVPHEGLRVAVRDGWVTLSGMVSWYDQWKKAQENVEALSGVRGVINQIGYYSR